MSDDIDVLIERRRAAKRASSRAFYWRNRDKILEKLRQRSDKQRAKGRAYSRRWRRANPEKSLALRSGWRTNNRQKTAAHNRKYYEKNKAVIYEKVKVWQKANRSSVRRSKKKSRAANLENERASARERYAENPGLWRVAKQKWLKANAGQVNAYTAQKRARKRQAQPKWLTAEQLEEMCTLYCEAKKQELHVDHIIPLNGETVCGLHVPWNLQFLTKSENSKKGNRLLNG